MKRQLGVFGNWCDAYMDAIDSLHGVREFPPMTLMEIGEEWQRVFGAMAVDQPETDIFLGGRDAYLNMMEELHGEWDLHPALSVRERCEEWQRCFGSSISLQVRTKPTGGESLRTLATA
ncbi:MAG: hypothetical protein ABRQ24_06085 [Syntrophomonadaceae bacterium]